MSDVLRLFRIAIVEKPLLRFMYLVAGERRVTPSLYLNPLSLQVFINREEVRDLTKHVRVNL